MPVQPATSSFPRSRSRRRSLTTSTPAELRSSAPSLARGAVRSALTATRSWSSRVLIFSALLTGCQTLSTSPQDAQTLTPQPTLEPRSSGAGAALQPTRTQPVSSILNAWRQTSSTKPNAAQRPSAAELQLQPADASPDTTTAPATAQPTTVAERMQTALRDTAPQPTNVAERMQTALRSRSAIGSQPAAAAAFSQLVEEEVPIGSGVPLSPIPSPAPLDPTSTSIDESENGLEVSPSDLPPGPTAAESTDGALTETPPAPVPPSDVPAGEVIQEATPAAPPVTPYLPPPPVEALIHEPSMFGTPAWETPQVISPPSVPADCPPTTAGPEVLSPSEIVVEPIAEGLVSGDLSSSPCPIPGGCGPSVSSPGLLGGNCLPSMIDDAAYAQAGLPHPFEYLCDGGDGDIPITSGGNKQIRGLELEDTVAQFSGRDGQTHVTASNRVCVYAPRFAAVRHITRVQIGDDYLSASAANMPTILEQAERRTPPIDVDQRQPVLGDHRTEVATPFIENTVGIELAHRHPIEELAYDYQVHEDFRVIRVGLYDATERIAMLEFLDAVTTWTINESAQVTVEDQSAYEIKLDQEVGTIYTFRDPLGPKLRLIKLASVKSAQSGETVEFTIRYDNVGNSEATDIVIVDNLTTRLEYVPNTAQCSHEAEFTTAENSGESLKLTWKLKEAIPAGKGGVIRFQCKVR